MRLKDALKLMIIIACVATVFQVIFISLFAWVSDYESTLYARELYRLPLTGILSTLPTLIFVGKENISARKLILIRSTHFILTMGIVFGALLYFGLIIDMSNILLVAVIFLITYIIATIIGERQARNLAQQLNERLDAFHNAENASHD